MDNKVPYNIYDNNGKVYTAYVCPEEVASLDMDHAKCFRLLTRLKNNGVQSAESWTDSFNVSQFAPGAVSSPKVSVEKNRARGTVVDWRGLAGVLLETCARYRTDLRVRRVPKPVWQTISNDMLQKGYDFKAHEIQAKIKNLKQDYRDAKNGKKPGWGHFSVMKFIYDDLLTTNETYVVDCIPNMPPTAAATPALRDATFVVTSGEVVVSVPKVTTEDSTFGVDEVLVTSTSAATHEVAAAFVDTSAKDDTVAAAKDGIASAVGVGFGETVTISKERLQTSILTEDIKQSNNFLSDEQPLPEVDNDFIDFEGDDLSVNMNPLHLSTDDTPDCSGLLVHQARDNVLTQDLRSPSSKKSRGGANQSNKKAATPKRKVAGQDWTKEKVDALLEACCSRKEDVQQDKVSDKVWKEISDMLLQQGLSIPHQECKTKFGRLNLLFSGTLLPLGGVMAGFKWPHYEQFCNLHDIPEDFVMPALNQSPNSDPGNKLWNKQAVLLLLAEYERLKKSFDNSKSGIRHSLLYAEITATLNAFDYPYSVKQVTDQMVSLKGTFRAEFDRLNVRSTGQNPSSWPYYDRMMEIFHGSPTLHAPYAVSVGRQLVYTVQGKSVNDQSRGTRTRPPSIQPQPTAKTTASKPWTQQQYETKVKEHASVADAIVQLSEAYDRNSERRNITIKTSIEALIASITGNKSFEKGN